MNCWKFTGAAAALAATAGFAHAQWVIDGQISPGDTYGGILWVQDTATGFGDNTAGQAGTPGNPADVLTGVEVKIPLATIGNPTLANGISMVVVLTANVPPGGNGSNISNQVSGGLPAAYTSTRLGPARATNLETVAGSQTLTLFPQVDAAAPVVDGQLDGGLSGYWAGRRVWTQSLPTTEQDNSMGQIGNANGSELDGIYAVVSGTDLYLFLTGNLHNFNKFVLFFDSAPGGQTRMLFGNNAQDFGFWGNMSSTSAVATDGLTFENGFAADHTFNFTTGTNNPMYVNYISLPTDDDADGQVAGGIGYYLGNSPAGQVGGDLTGGNAAGDFLNVKASFNNSNNAGVGSGVPTVTPSRDVAVGSEIDGLYGRIDGDYLYLLVTGNLENNWNKLALFFDADPLEGQNVLRADNVDLSFNGLNRMGFGGNGTPGAGNGITFDADFFADYVMFVTNGNNPVDMYTDCAVLRANGPRLISGFVADYSSFHGGPKATTDPNNFPATYAHYQDFSRVQLQSDAPARMVGDWALLQPPPNPGPDYNNLPPEFADQIRVTIDNNNVAGVTDVSVVGAELVTTGIEIRVPLSEIGCIGCASVKVAGGILSDGFGVASNQWLGGVGGVPNLGEPSLIDFTAMSGTQYIVVTAGAPPCDPDVNCDGSVNGFDIEATEQAVNGDYSNFCQASADLNNDGAENGFDIETEEQRVNGEPC
ncbi:hypothetical protein PHYC_00074 [Phycisphaerales bacterium]|nr:hypothetical protein PHYC_00074 [Phycisphaerales bacterium]